MCRLQNFSVSISTLSQLIQRLKYLHAEILVSWRISNSLLKYSQKFIASSTTLTSYYIPVIIIVPQKQTAVKSFPLTS